jgi:hypothetical protein
MCHSMVAGKVLGSRPDRNAGSRRASVNLLPFGLVRESYCFVTGSLLTIPTIPHANHCLSSANNRPFTGLLESLRGGSVLDSCSGFRFSYCPLHLFQSVNAVTSSRIPCTL